MVLNQHLAVRLPRSLSSIETWSFGLTGHVGWIGTASAIHAALGPKAIFVWLPGVLVSVLLNLQVQRLGMLWPDIAGGTPNYAARLLSNFPGLGRYVALGYFGGWVAAPAVYALILTDLIQANLEPLGIDCPETLLKFGFICVAFIVGFSGTRALSILHLFFVIPALAFLLAFCFQGIGWLAFSSAREGGLFPTHWSNLSFGEWAKWFFLSTYSVYCCETAASFVADSRRPDETLWFLSSAAWLIPPVFLGGSWVLIQLPTQPGSGENLYLNLLAAAHPFWGESASFLVTLLIAFSCLLNCATAVSNTPRILYQLALDGHLSPVFAVMSRRGVMAPALILTFLISLFCLVWGNLSHIVMVAGTGYLVSIMGIHLGLWLHRDRPEVLLPWWSLGFFIVEAVVLVVGGLAWSWQNLVYGFLFPIAILALDAAIRRTAFAPLQPAWWSKQTGGQSYTRIKDFVPLQVGILIILLCNIATVAWMIRARLDGTASRIAGDNLFICLLVTVAFVGVAIACWATLPQVAAMAEAREHSEHLFTITIDAIVVLDDNGVIRKANPATEQLFGVNTSHLLGLHLNKLLSGLAQEPEHWSSRSEQALIQSNQSLRTIEVAVSARADWDRQEYVAILRDITATKLAEEQLRAVAERERLLAAVALRIRQSLELDEIVNNTVAEVRQFLQADRVLIYRHESNRNGVLVAESVGAGWNSVASVSIREFWFEERIEFYRQGNRFVVDDIQQVGVPVAQLKIAQERQVKAFLAVPILQGDQLWGVLEAHQCSKPRHWELFEVDLLCSLATQVAIAIQQSQLYKQVQNLNIDLERQVQERTVQLQQALNFEAVLKRVTDKVRDSLDEGQILQTVVQELAFVLGVDCCDAALYNLDQTTSTIYYEYALTGLPSAQGQEFQILDSPEIYHHLLQGQYLQFCRLVIKASRPQAAILACPIFDERGTIGDLWVFKQRECVFNELEIRLVQQVANQCAIAIRQARLYQSAQAQVAQLEAVNILKDDFLSTVSHELRTPLSNMKMAIYMLKLAEAGEKRDRYLQILQAECDRETELINDLLDLQRLESGVNIDRSPLQLQDWLPSIIEPFRSRTHERQQILRFELAPNLPTLTSDRAALERILAELLNNACKYTPPGGEIAVSVRHVSAPVPAIIFAIRNAAEIPAAQLPLIFDKFYRIPSNDPWRQGGTGLGLALVKKLVEQLGGEIQVESQAGQTTFTVQLPQGSG